MDTNTLATAITGPRGGRALWQRALCALVALVAAAVGLTGSRCLPARPVLRLVAAMAVVAGLLAFPLAAFADKGWVGDSGTTSKTVNLAAEPGATVLYDATIGITYSGTYHLSPGTTVTWTVSRSQTTLPGDYSVGPEVGLTIPSPEWNRRSPEPTGQSTVRFTAPASPGRYTYIVKWTTIETFGNELTGYPALTINLTVAPSAAKITASATTASGGYVAGAWTKETVTVHFACTGTYTGTCPVDQAFAADGANQTASATIYDVSGIPVTATFGPINVDKTSPSITLLSRTPANAAGWNKGDVTVAWACSDVLSGAVNSTLTQTVSAEGAGQSATGTCTDLAGNSASDTQTGINVDKTAPTISGEVDRGANANGWYNADVLVSFTCVDALSGIASCTAPQTVGEGALQSVSGTATDLAGNSAPSTVFGIRIDKTPPTISAAATKADFSAYKAGDWTNQDVSVTFTCGDALSGVDTCPGAVVYNEEGEHEVSGSATDLAGNTSLPVSFGLVRIDKTAPAITGALDRVANADGWYNADVTVKFTCSDERSGLASPCPGDVTLSVSTATVTGSVSDLAGNSAASTVTNIRIDKVLPAISATATSGGTPYTPGSWTNQDVVVTFICSDTGSGLAGACPEPMTVTSSIALITGSAKDLAGNSASASFGPVNIDRTPPTIAGTVSPTVNDNGWYNADVTVSFTCSDTLAGIATCPPPYKLTSDGANQSVIGTATDAAGNTATATVSGINVDKTAPSISLFSRTPANAAGWNKTDVTIVWACADGLSGVVSSTVTQTVAAEGVGRSATGTCQDLAGNSVSDTQTGINIDKTAPTITGAPDRGANTAGWYNADVLVSFTCGDTLAGIDTCTTPQTAGEGANQSVTGKATDKAGNIANATVTGINVDITAPTVTASAISGGAPYTAGNWTNQDVIVSFTCSDAGSGLAVGACPSDVKVSTSTALITERVSDLAGNSASASFGPVNIDKTPPTSSVRFVGELGAYGSGPRVMVYVEASDARTGVLTSGVEYSFDNENWKTYSGPFELSDTKTKQTVYVRATDALGNEGVQPAEFNPWQKFPLLTYATATGSAATVKGELEGTADTNYGVSLFAPASGCGVPILSEPIPLKSVTVTALGEATPKKFAFDLNAPDLNGRLINEPQRVVAVASTAGSNVSYAWCRPVSTTNLNWQEAATIASGAAQSQFIVHPLYNKWFKFPVTPGASLKVEYEGKPGSVVTLHRDPTPLFNELSNPTDALKVSANGNGSASLPYDLLPYDLLPYDLLPYDLLPYDLLPYDLLPYDLLPYDLLPYDLLPYDLLPYDLLPYDLLPYDLLPYDLLPYDLLPAENKDAYSAAARGSLIAYAVDADRNSSTLTLETNTYDTAGYLYLRVDAPYDPDHAFTVKVTVTPGVCGADLQLPTGAPTTFASTELGHKTLIFVDSSRLTASSAAEKTAALSKLGTLAGLDDVKGLVLDLGNATRFPRVASANANADANKACPTYKNVVALEIKRLIDEYRAASGGTLEYVVLAGGSDDIPNFQLRDVSGAGFERDYSPPVANLSASEAGLRTNLVQAQYLYGSAKFDLGDYPPPSAGDLAVGRLVGPASAISAAVDTYIRNNGTLTPRSSLVTGYSFVSDGAKLAADELEAGTGAAGDRLIQAEGEGPNGPTAWTADQLRALLLPKDHDVVYINGHFDAGHTLAADGKTVMAATELTETAVKDNLFLSLGCHAGYNVALKDRTAASPEDWAKIIMQKGGAGNIAPTAFAYGDTILPDYGERFFIGLARQFRTSTEAVPLGKALAKAQAEYLSQTAQRSGIDEKTAMEMALYGLPMMKVDMPVNPLTAMATAATSTLTPTPVATGTWGTQFGLSTQSLHITPSFTQHPVTLDTPQGILTSYYLSGKDGVEADPTRPILPLEFYPVDGSSAVLRGVVFRGAQYEERGMFPVTSAPGIQYAYPLSEYKSDIFYRTQFWNPLFPTSAGGATRLAVTPAQYRTATERRITSADFDLYYLPGDWTSSYSADKKAAAVALAPRVVGVSVVPDGTGVKILAHILDEGLAGVQTVLVTYTTGPGAPVNGVAQGTWSSIEMARSGGAADPTLWTATINGVDQTKLRFFVQAVSGTGFTTLSTNLGNYFSVEGAAGQSTSLTAPVSDPSGTLVYGTKATFTATLKSGTNPLGGKQVVFNIGGRYVLAETGTDGVATALGVPLLLPPGTHTVTASFLGSDTGCGGSACLPSLSPPALLTVAQATSAMAIRLDPNPLDPQAVVVTLTSGADKLEDKLVIFEVVAGTTHTYQSAFTNYDGEARLALPVPPSGPLTVKAYFGQAVPVGGGQSAGQLDLNYGPSSATISVYDTKDTASGSGTIDVPAGSCVLATCSPTTKGRASFAFSAQYAGGLPTAIDTKPWLSFTWKPGSLDFKSSSYDWFVATFKGSTGAAMIQGTGKITGLPGDYKFLAIALDNAPDRFRIIIWEASKTYTTPVFDNKWRDNIDNDLDLTEALVSGTITVINNY